MVTVRQVTAGIIGAVVVTLVLSQFAGVAVMINSDLVERPLVAEDGSAQFDLGVTQTVRYHNGTQASLGTAVELDGTSTSEVVVDADIKADTDSSEWSVCTWATPSAAADNTTGTLLKYEDAAIVYNGTSDEYRGYYYDSANRSAVDVTLADNGTATPKLLCLQRDGGDISMHRNTTGAAIVTIDSESGVAPPPSEHFAGVVEETRIYAHALNSSQRSEWVSEPSLAIKGPNPAARLMYDARSGTSFPAFFAGGTATASNAQLVDGLDAPTLTEGADYQWSGTLDNQLTIPDGSLLEQSGSIVYARVTLSTGGIVDRVFSVATSALGLLIIGISAIALWGFIDDF